MNRLIFYAWAFIVCAAIAQAALAYPELPDRFATHFAVDGTPNGWSSRGQFYAIWAFALVMVNMAPLIIGPMLRGMPREIVNIPRKDYWYATPERTAWMIEVVRATLAGAMGMADLIMMMAFRLVTGHAHGASAALSPAAILVPVAFIVLFSIGYPLIALGTARD